MLDVTDKVTFQGSAWGVAYAAWWASALTSMLWELVTNQHHPMLPVGYGCAHLLGLVIYKVNTPNTKSSHAGAETHD